MSMSDKPGQGGIMQTIPIKSAKLSPGEVVRAYCRDCVGSERFNDDIRDCTESECAFHPYRNGRRVSVKVHRRFCLQCANGSHDYVANCPTRSCPVWPYRMGKNPNRIGKGHFATLAAHRNALNQAVNGGLSSWKRR